MSFQRRDSLIRLELAVEIPDAIVGRQVDEGIALLEFVQHSSALRMRSRPDASDVPISFINK